MKQIQVQLLSGFQAELLLNMVYGHPNLFNMVTLKIMHPNDRYI